MSRYFYLRNFTFKTVLYFLPLSFIAGSCKTDDRSAGAAGKYPLNLAADTARILGYYRPANGLLSDSAKLMLMRKGIKESIDRDYNDGIVMGVLTITATFFERGKFDSCYKYFELAFQYTGKHIFEKSLIAKLYINYGTFYFLQGQYAKADSMYYSGLQSLPAEHAEDHLKFTLLYNLHFTKSLIGRKDLAIRYVNEAEMLSRHNKDSANLKLALIAKAQYYCDENQMGKAQIALNESISVNKGVYSLDQFAVAGAVWGNSDHPGKAVPLLLTGINEAAKQNVDFKRIEMSFELANVFNKLKLYRKSELILKPTIKESIEKGFNDQLKDGYTYLAEAYEKQGEYKYALATLKKLHNLNDSLLNGDQRRTLNELEVKYQTAEKDKQLTINNLKIAQQQNRIGQQTTLIITISAAIILLLLTFLSFTLYKRHQLSSIKHQQEINNLISRMEGEENERQRIARDLHDSIGGSLSTVLMHTAKLEEQYFPLKRSGTFEAITNLLRNTATELRRIANNLMPDPVIRLGLTQAIKEYCFSLQKPTLHINVQTYGELAGMNVSLQLTIYRIVQELLHNIIRHSNATEAMVQVAVNNNIIGVTVEDNGEGFDKETVVSGNGLSNIRHRVGKLGGTFSLSSVAEQGTAVTIEFPL